MGNGSPAAGKDKLRRIANAAPFGIIAGSCAIVVFFATVGFVVAHLVLSGIAGATNSTSSMFENWWQVLLFVADLLFLVATLASLAMFIIRVVLNKRAEKDDKISADSEVSDEN